MPDATGETCKTCRWWGFNDPQMSSRSSENIEDTQSRSCRCGPPGKGDWVWRNENAPACGQWAPCEEVGGG